jgi:Kef-type K+ transport system membrane component KefB
MTATIVDDLINWTLFAIILRDIMPAGQATASLPRSIALVASLFVLIVGLGRWLGPRALHWAKAHVTWPSGFIALIALLILVASSISVDTSGRE